MPVRYHQSRGEDASPAIPDRRGQQQRNGDYRIKGVNVQQAKRHAQKRRVSQRIAKIGHPTPDHKWFKGPAAHAIIPASQPGSNNSIMSDHFPGAVQYDPVNRGDDCDDGDKSLIARARGPNIIEIKFRMHRHHFRRAEQQI